MTETDTQPTSSSDEYAMRIALDQAGRCIETGATLRAELRLSRGDAGQIWLRCHARPQPLDGGGALWHAYVEDVTELRGAAL